MVERLVFKSPVSLLSNWEDTDRPTLKSTQAAVPTIITTIGRGRRRRNSGLVGVMEANQQPVKAPISYDPKSFNRSHVSFLKITPFLLLLLLSPSTITDPLDHHYFNISDCGCGSLSVSPGYRSWELLFLLLEKSLASERPEG